jgi:myosin-5
VLLCIFCFPQAIRETGSDEEENYKLEKQVEELRCCFPSEKHPKVR